MIQQLLNHREIVPALVRPVAEALTHRMSRHRILNARFLRRLADNLMGGVSSDRLSALPRLEKRFRRIQAPRSRRYSVNAFFALALIGNAFRFPVLRSLITIRSRILPFSSATSPTVSASRSDMRSAEFIPRVKSA